MAALEIGAVRHRPMIVETAMPMGTGASVVALLMSVPSPVISAEIGGPTNVPVSPPQTMVTIGTSTMSTGVRPATRFPSSAPTTAARNAPTGPPRS